MDVLGLHYKQKFENFAYNLKILHTKNYFGKPYFPVGKTGLATKMRI